jgi:23S rRNA (uracil1939-C5)-methyltransferase
VIEVVAARKPRRVLHLFCNSDSMPGEVMRWKESGYVASWARPFDMFPGTPVVEFLIAFEPGDGLC